MCCRTTLRELLQNAADASASKVTIKFETLPSTNVPTPQSPTPSSALKHILQHHTLQRLLITNNGQTFGATDWSRLKRIAEGNPDETKIGAFGVGFYSVFADCEEPFVSSGKEAMAFYWKENALFTRRLQLPESEASSDTSFVLDYRNTTSPVPPLQPLCQFLAGSLTFIAVSEIELWLDSYCILKLSKKTAPSVEISIPKEVGLSTSEGLMKIAKVSREVSQLDAEWLNIVGWKPTGSKGQSDGNRTAEAPPSLRTFFSKLAGNPSNAAAEKAAREEKVLQETLKENLAKTSRATVFMHTSIATIRTSVSSSFSQELERATKKPPPKVTKLAILTSSHDEGANPSPANGKPASVKAVEIFSTVLPSKAGRIFIGFPTHQTTGFKAHISAPSVIPTVERESIDLNARWVRTWNKEMLRAAGIVCRIAWSAEMSAIKENISRSTAVSKKGLIHKEDIEAVLPEAVHLLNQYTPQESTPSSQVGQLVEEAFWTCSKKPSIDILSTCGILPSHQVRLATEDLSFVEGVPVLPKALTDGAQPFIRKLTEFGLITEVTVSDIKTELEAKALKSEQLVEFLGWLTRKLRAGDIDGQMIRSLLNAAVANDLDDRTGEMNVVVLSEITYFANPSRIPLDLPMPPNTMPFKYTSKINKNDLAVFGWEELQIVPWLRWLVENANNRAVLPEVNDITKSANFASSVLPVLSKSWDVLSQSSKGTVGDLLVPRTVVPTKLGMKRPPEAYFASVKLFDDLPTISGLQGVKEKFLGSLGVRKTIELGVVFDRLLNASTSDKNKLGEGKWSHVDLVKYLASVRDDIPNNDIIKLKNTSICPAEVTSKQEKTPGVLHKASELYEPKDDLRALGMPTLQWPGIYRPGSNEGKLLSLLGLRAFPPPEVVLQIMAKAGAGKDWPLRDKSMTYFVNNHATNGYAAFDASKVPIAFLPIQGEREGLRKPSQCFTDEGATLFGFDLLHIELQPHASKFGVSQHPPMKDCVDHIVSKPPTTKKEARQLYTYFAGRMLEISSSDSERLGTSKIVPIVSTKESYSEKASKTRWEIPRNCFLGDSETYSEIFDFVDFGQQANLFLLKCGSKHEPSKVEVAWMLVKEPARIFSTLSIDRYQNLLRTLAQSLVVLKKDKLLYKEMKTAPFLLASKEVLRAQPARGGEDIDADEFDDEEKSIKEWQLTRARDCMIADDWIYFRLFRQYLLAAPQEEVLEDFYIALGAPSISSSVDEQARTGAVMPDQRDAAKLQTRVFERSRLFLYDQPPDSIKHDAKWLENNLVVRIVSSISIRRTLQGTNFAHTEKKTASVTYGKEKKWILQITPKYDLYQVSGDLAYLLLTRPKLHSTITLEMILKSDLYELRARGYNVGRILRQKAAEQRIAEEKRREQLEQERRELQERELQWNDSQAQLATRPKAERESSMPGVFPDSPEQHVGPDSTQANGTITQPNEDRRPRGLFSNITKRFGFDDNRSIQRLQDSLSGTRSAATPREENPPPPYAEADPSGSKQKKPTQPTKAVTAPHQLQQNLLSAVQKSRAHGSSDVYSRGETNRVKETTSYCDERPAHDLTLLAESPSGMKIYISKDFPDRSDFLARNSTALEMFSQVLRDVASVFTLRPDAVHIHYDASGKTIAFNRSGSVFCNYLFFEQLHLEAVQRGEKAEALVYWWVIFCHELAHNLVGDHGPDHSYYT